MVMESNADLLAAFPSRIREDVMHAVAALPRSPHSSGKFSVTIDGEAVSIPQRIYHDPLGISVWFRVGLRSQVQKDILNCIFTRHADGFIREERLRRIIRSEGIWIPPFVIQLAGEYVIEILRIIVEHLPNLDRELYSGFVRDNPKFIEQTKQRIMSYWDCYYRSIPREEYPGLRIHAFLEELGKNKGPAGTGPGAKRLRANS